MLRYWEESDESCNYWVQNTQNLDDYLPDGITEIVSGGAKGIDEDAQNYALQNQIPLTEFLPDYQRYGRGAPLKRNLQIIEYADVVLAIWDGKSRGTKFVIDHCKKNHVPLRVIYWPAVQQMNK